jgi:serine/threonine protein phosphatase 1
MHYVMSDCHDRYDLFLEMLEKIQFSGEDQLWFLGDAIDRGNGDGIKILQHIRSVPNIHMLLGNHEHMMLQALADGTPDVAGSWIYNGGRSTLKALGNLSPEERTTLVRWMAGLPVEAYVEVDGRKFYLVHGWPGDSPWDMVWGRPRNGDEKNPVSDCTLIVGHTPVYILACGNRGLEGYILYMNRQGLPLRIFHGKEFIDLDCGCGHDYPCCRLSCLRLEDMEEFYVG